MCDWFQELVFHDISFVLSGWIFLSFTYCSKASGIVMIIYRTDILAFMTGELQRPFVRAYYNLIGVADML